jgi:hypothetical protein
VELDARRLSVAVPERIQAWFAAEGCPVRVIKSEGRAAALSSWNVMPEAGCAEQGQLVPAGEKTQAYSAG